jgi:hypothetical protein
LIAVGHGGHAGIPRAVHAEEGVRRAREVVEVYRHDFVWPLNVSCTISLKGSCFRVDFGALLIKEPWEFSKVDYLDLSLQLFRIALFPTPTVLRSVLDDARAMTYSDFSLNSFD